MARYSVPTTSKLPSHLRVSSQSVTVTKIISRLSREGLIALALSWLEDESLPHSFPHLKTPTDKDYLDDDVGDLYPPASSIDELRQLYSDLQTQKGSRRDVVGRVLEGDWRDGVTLYQLAMVDMAYFEEHPSSQRWTAYQILPLETPSGGREDEVLQLDKKSLTLPRFHPSTFLQNLQSHSLPDVKAHYHFYRPKGRQILLMRIFILDSPYNSSLSLSSLDNTGKVANFDSARVIYLAFPDGAPSLFISKPVNIGSSAHGEASSLRTLIVDGVPKALSRPRQRFTLKSSGLASKNLDALAEIKGAGRTNAAGGGWSVYADDKKRASPLDSVLPSPPLSAHGSDPSSSLKEKTKRPITQHESESDRVFKKARVLAKARFGQSGLPNDGKGVERVEITMQDPFPGRTESRTPNKGENQEEEDPDDVVSSGRRRRTSTRQSLIDAALSTEPANIQEEETDEGEEARDGTQQRRRSLSGAAKSSWAPDIQLTFHGPHVFAGVRQLVEAGIVDGERMPGWMTGEEGVTTGVVRHGRIRGFRGSGV